MLKKKDQKPVRWLGALLTPPSECVYPPEGQTLSNHGGNRQRSRQSLYKCAYQIEGLYIIFEAMGAEKWFWPIFGCKVGQSVPIGMKLELGMWHYLLNVYTMFQIGISKHLWKSPKNFTKSETSKNNYQNSENTIFAKTGTYVEKSPTGHLRTKLDEFT